MDGGGVDENFGGDWTTFRDVGDYGLLYSVVADLDLMLNNARVS